MADDKTRSLDLGCGLRPKNFFNASLVYGIDNRDDVNERVHRADLILEPIPFADEFFDFVTAHDFLEHIPRLLYVPARKTPFVDLMNEIWRVLKPGGRFLSQTPAFPQPAAFTDPTHVNIITDQTFPIYFCGPLWAKPYGFVGMFELIHQQWNGPHLITVLERRKPIETDDATSKLAF